MLKIMLTAYALNLAAVAFVFVGAAALGISLVPALFLSTIASAATWAYLAHLFVKATDRRKS
jgi:hypothetical protein